MLFVLKESGSVLVQRLRGRGWRWLNLGPNSANLLNNCRRWSLHIFMSMTLEWLTMLAVRKESQSISCLISGNTFPVPAPGEGEGSAVDEEYIGKDIAVVFGRHFLANPDLPSRLRFQIPLNQYDSLALKLQSRKGTMQTIRLVRSFTNRCNGSLGHLGRWRHTRAWRSTGLLAFRIRFNLQ